jgi:hypothetical protein
LVKAQTRAIIQPTKVQPQRIVTAQIAPRLWCLRELAITPGRSQKKTQIPKRISKTTAAAPEPAAVEESAEDWAKKNRWFSISLVVA